MRTRCLVTGGAGFIGSHLTEHLLLNGSEVVVLDDLSTGRIENISHLLDDERFRFVEGSILNPALVRRLASACGEIYHLASAVGVRFVFENPVETIKINIHGVENILEAAEEGGQKLMFASTSEVYGNGIENNDTLFSEYGTIRLGTSVRWIYAATKAVDEYMVRAYGAKHQVSFLICRYFNVIGARQSGEYGMVVPRMVKAALRDEPLIIYGDGEQTRSFAWVGDIVDATVRLMEEPSANGQTLNVGSDRPVTINELARRIKSLCDSDSKIVHVPFEQVYDGDFEDIRNRHPDITKLKETIRFDPGMNLDTTLMTVIEYHRSGLNVEEYLV